MEPRDIPNLERAYRDYFQGADGGQDELSNSFGVRLREGYYSVIVKNRDGQVYPSGNELHLPIELEELPIHVRWIVEDHMRNNPASDLVADLTGRQSFQQVLNKKTATSGGAG